MQLKEKNFKDNQAILTIEAEAKEVEEALEKTHRRLVEEVNIPGFRKGKAPREVLEREIGKDRLFDEALEYLLPVLSAQAVEAEGLAVISRPAIQVVNREPLVFNVTVPLPPQVKLGDYTSIRAEPNPAVVDDAMVDKMIDALRQERAVWQPVERAAQYGDLAVIDVKSNVEGEDFLNQEGVNIIIRENHPSPLPGFNEELIGMPPGEQKEFGLVVPEDYPDPNKAGKTAHFEVRLNALKEEVLPQLDDEFARGFGSDIKDIADLRNRVKESLQFQADEKAREEMEDAVIDKLAEQSEISFPPIILETELNYLMELQLQQMRRSASSQEQLQAWLNNISPEGMRTQLTPLAERRVRQGLVLDKLAEEAKLEASAEEIDAEIERQVSYAGGDERQRERLNTPRNRESIRRIILRRKAVALLVEGAQGKEDDSGKEAESADAGPSSENEEV